MNKLLLTLLCMMSAGITFSQEAQLAEPFFNDVETATARSMGTAGAFGSVGADFSNATNNPAGLAFYRKKELGLNIGYTSKDIETSYLNESLSTTTGALGLNNVAYAYSNLQTRYIGDSLAVKREGLVGWSIVAGMNKKSFLREDIEYDAFNTDSSLMSAYTTKANRTASTINELGFYERQAYDVGLLEYDGTSFTSETRNGRVQQNGFEERNGARREYFIGGGANFSNELYVGATIGIPSVKYETYKTYKETDEQDLFANFERSSLRTNSEYKSAGAYLNLGAIYRLNDYFRVGAKVQTPTLVQVDEETILGLNAAYNGGTNQDTNETFTSIYNLTLPMKAGLQMTASHPKYGLISIEGDYIDYTGTRLKYNSENDELYADDSFRDAERAFKQSIKDNYKGAMNLRGGVEARLLQNLRLRGGYAFYDSPYKSAELELGNDYSKKVLALGLGYRVVPANLTLDLGFNQIKNGEYDFDYYDTFNNVANNVDISRTTNLVQLGISKRFNQ